tara:strand:- start:248 stop:556 length:309 start_codon:yes stop_codon:yes gene_type:complete
MVKAHAKAVQQVNTKLILVRSLAVGAQKGGTNLKMVRPVAVGAQQGGTKLKEVRHRVQGAWRVNILTPTQEQLIVRYVLKDGGKNRHNHQHARCVLKDGLRD